MRKSWFSPIDLALVGALLLVLIVELFGGPLIGLANSGDFERLMLWGNVVYPPLAFQDKYFAWVVPHFVFCGFPPFGLGGYFSSEAPFIKLAATLSYLGTAGRTFDLRVLGVLHLLAFGAALLLLLRGWRAATKTSGLWLAPGLALMFTDVGYGAYFNSLYSEPASLIFMVASLGAGLLLIERVDHRRLSLFFALMLLMMTAKTQNFALVVPLALFGARLYQLNPNCRKHLRRWTIAVVCVAGLQFLVNPPFMTQANEYSTVFNGILRDSKTPAADLQALGLDPKLAVLAGTNEFMTHLPIDINGPPFQRDFYAHFSHAKALVFYATHPARFLDEMAFSAGKAFTLRPGYLGSFTKASGRPAGAHSQAFDLWSRLKGHHLPATLPFVVGDALALFALIGAGWLKFRRRLLAEFYLALLAMMAIAFVTPYLGDGQSDLEKHLFLFNVLFDLALLLLSAHAFEIVYRKLFVRAPGNVGPRLETDRQRGESEASHLA